MPTRAGPEAGPPAPGFPAGPGDGGGERLACGRPVADVVDQADAGRLEPADDHQRGCASCRRALVAAARGAEAVALLRGIPAAARVPPGLADRVVRRLRVGLPAGRLVGLSPRPRAAGAVAGVLGVRSRVLVDLARAAADGVPGVRVTRAREVPAAAPAPFGVALELAVDGRVPLRSVAAAVRRAVRASLLRSADAAPDPVELAATGLLDPEAPPTGQVRSNRETQRNFSTGAVSNLTPSTTSTTPSSAGRNQS